MKGSEEREFMFGKLFACISIVRSGRLLDDAEGAVSVLSTLRDLFFMRHWIREAVVEAVILLMGTGLD